MLMKSSRFDAFAQILGSATGGTGPPTAWLTSSLQTGGQWAASPAAPASAPTGPRATASATGQCSAVSCYIVCCQSLVFVSLEIKRNGEYISGQKLMKPNACHSHGG